MVCGGGNIFENIFLKACLVEGACKLFCFRRFSGTCEVEYKGENFFHLDKYIEVKFVCKLVLLDRERIFQIEIIYIAQLPHISKGLIFL